MFTNVMKVAARLVAGLLMMGTVFFVAPAETDPTIAQVINHDTLIPGGTILPAATPPGGGVSAQAVIGTDERAQITTTADPPWRWITYLEIDLDPDSYDPDAQCTGFFIGPRHVLTAGHCLYTPSTADWSDFVRVVPGKSGFAEPFGDETVGVSALAVSSGWASGLGAAYDYGLIELTDETLHNQVGSFGYAVLPDEQLLNAGINLAGYPIDKFPPGSLWFDANTIKHVGARIISHEADTFSGQSGSPIWGSDGTHRFVVGIHTYAAGSPSCNPGDNCGTRITAEVADALELAGAYPRITDLAAIPCHSLTKSADPQVGGTFTHSPPNSGGCPTNSTVPNFALTTSVFLDAVPSGGYAFLNWTGADDPDLNPTTVTIDGSEAVTAHFDIDTDGDAIGDSIDICPAWTNPGQEPLPWSTPPGDADCDGFLPARESHVGTNASVHCNDNSNPNDEPDAWPADFNDTQGTTLGDVVMMGSSFNKSDGQAGYNQRFDLNATFSVTLADVISLGPYFNHTCQP